MGDEEIREWGGKLNPQVDSKRMEWWNDLKFGMMIHWGPWSQRETGSIWRMWFDSPEERKGYFELYKSFDPHKFDADEWIGLAKRAGMNYFVFTAKHHDGFCHWDTKTTDLRVTAPECPYSGSSQPDIISQLSEACHREEIALGFYFSHIDWHDSSGKLFSEYQLHKGWTADEREKTRADQLRRVDDEPENWQKFVDLEKDQIRELLSNYGKVDFLWFDIWWPSAGYSKPIGHPRVKRDVFEVLEMARSLQPGLIVNNRGTDMVGDFETPEQKIPPEPPLGWWETNMTLSDPSRRTSGGFWYKGRNAPAKDLEELLRVVVEVFSKGGNFLLNIGPAPDGSFPPQAVERLTEVGDWMRTNSEAVYGSKGNPLPENPEWGYITRRAKSLYLFVFEWDLEVSLQLPVEIERARLLGDDREVEFKRRSNETVAFALPEKAPHSVASVVALDLAEEISDQV